MITVTELARRLCLAEHTLFHTGLTAPQSVPCSQHIVMAQKYIFLTTLNGAPALKVLLEAAQQEGSITWPEIQTPG